MTAKCCGLGVYWEPLYYIPAPAPPPAPGQPPPPARPGKVRFAAAPVCAACRKVVGDVTLDKNESKTVKAIQKLYNGTSWAMMADWRKHPPFNFERRDKGPLAPEGYKGELKAQGQLLQQPDEAEFT